LRGASFGTEACAGGRLEWQAWIFATLEGRQGRPGVGLLLGNIRLEGVGGRWVLGVRRWMPLPAATTRSPDGILCEAPLYVVLKHPSRWRSDPRRFIFGALGGRQGVGCWALGVRQGRPGGVGCWVLGVGRWVLYRAATRRSPDGILCRASLDVVLKHPSSWRRDPWGFIFGRWVFGRWVLGVGCWALGARQGHPRGSSRRRRHFTGTSIARLEAPIEGVTTV